MEGKKANMGLKEKVLRRVTNQGRKPGTIALYDKITNWLVKFSGDKCIKDLDSSDIDGFISKLRTRAFSSDKMPNLKGKKETISNTTLDTYQRILDKTMKIIHDIPEKSKEVPDCMKLAEKPKKDKRKLQKSDILSVQEVQKIVEVTENPRDRCLFKLLYESACRVGCEFLQLRRQDVIMRDDELVLYIRDGKTGPREVLCTQSIPEVQAWLTFYPDKRPEAYLFPGRYKNEHLNKDTVASLLKKLALRAGIQKCVWPHLLRHSRLTEVAKILTEVELRLFAGWEDNSPMASVYVHLNNDDVNSKLRKAANLPHKEIVESGLVKEAEVCTFGHKSPIGSQFCAVCGQALGEMAEEIEKNSLKRGMQITELMQQMTHVQDELANTRDLICRQQEEAVVSETLKTTKLVRESPFN